MMHLLHEESSQCMLVAIGCFTASGRQMKNVKASYAAGLLMNTARA